MQIPLNVSDDGVDIEVKSLTEVLQQRWYMDQVLWSANLNHPRRPATL